MTYNYHTHTYFCHHASGEIEDYIIRAIDCGITHMGFSDHAPHILKDGTQSGYRVEVSKVGEYFGKVSRLREKYKDKIDIKIGFEMEYYPECFKKMLQNVINYGAEYLILGEHFVEEENYSSVQSGLKNENTDFLKKYVCCVVEGIKSGAFTYVAHPDMINFTGDIDNYKKEIRKICVASREYNIPLEINFLGIRGMRNYPNEIFWQVAGEEKSPVTFGFDAHTAFDAYDGASLSKAIELVEKYKLNYIGKPNLILPQIE